MITDSNRLVIEKTRHGQTVSKIIIDFECMGDRDEIYERLKTAVKDLPSDRYRVGEFFPIKCPHCNGTIPESTDIDILLGIGTVLCPHCKSGFCVVPDKDGVNWKIIEEDLPSGSEHHDKSGESTR